MNTPLMPKATAVWLVDNTTLTFDQIAEFVGMHPLEIAGIADGEVAVGIKGFDPVANNQLSREEIEKAENDPKRSLKLLKPPKTPEQKKKAPRYTPLSKRQDRPAAIAWLVRNHPELADSQISKLLGTTKQTIEAIRNKTHWNSSNIVPVDPVALGLCRQLDLDAAVRVAAERREKELAATGAAGGAAGATLLSTEETLSESETETPTLKGFEGMESFGLPDDEDEDEKRGGETVDPEALFNLPNAPVDDEDEEDDHRR
ncbi:MAG: cell cycle transcriptional regulator TrcR [Pseudomonadota bacterium]